MVPNINLSSEQQRHERLLAFGDKSPSHATVFAYYRELKTGQISLHDEVRAGRPYFSVAAGNTEDETYNRRRSKRSESVRFLMALTC